MILQTKNIWLIFLAVSHLCQNTASGQAVVSTNVFHPTISKYDLNQNGKIDVNERKPYVQELSRERRKEAKIFAAQQPVLSPEERLFYEPPQLTPELIKKYDSNQDGKLDNAERLIISQEFTDAAKTRFSRFDTNQDGKLDKEEMKAVEQARQAELTRPTVVGSTTNSPASSKDGRATAK